MPDFFISYTQLDKDWAEWIAVQLEAAGYSTYIQAWDAQPGANIVEEMQNAAVDCDRVIAVLSAAYLKSRWTTEEWTAAFKDKKLLPIKVRPCEPKGLLGTRSYLDLIGKEEGEAR